MIDFDPDDTAQPGPAPGPARRIRTSPLDFLRDVRRATTVEVAEHCGLSTATAYRSLLNLYPMVRHVGHTVRGTRASIWEKR